MSVTDDFKAFWAEYPLRVGKLDALKAYTKARTLASADELLAGVQQYIQHKPDYAAWSHPSSWLNKGRWMDCYDTPQPKPKTTGVYKLYVPFRDRKQG